MSSRVWVVLFKELREIFRDGRSRFNLIISPLLITPMIIFLATNVVKDQMTKAQTENITVGLTAGKGSEQVQKAVQADTTINFVPVSTADAEGQIKKRTLKAVLVLPDGADEQLRQMRPVKLHLLLDEGSDSSQTAAERLTKTITRAGQTITAERLHENGLSMELALPFDTIREPIKGSGNVGVLLLSMFLPYILAVYAIMGGVSPANDTVAGEKERGTLETLLMSAASRRDLVTGKFLAVASAALVSSFLSVIGLFIGLSMRSTASINFSLKPLALMTIMLVQIPLAVLGAGLLLTISTFARNQKEAQTYLAPVLVLVTVAAMMSMFLKPESGIWYALVPVLNAALVVKGSLDGTFNLAFVALACVASLIYAGIAVVVAVRLFEKESVLLKA